jgi:hypothetical protein
MLRALLLAGLVATTAGCAGTVIVDYAIEAQVSGRDAAGHVWRARPEEITFLPRPPGLLSPFDAVQYRSDLFEWIFGTGSLGLGGKVTNLSPNPMCLRFDEARLTSNMKTGEVPLLVSSWRRFADGQLTRLGSTRPENRRYFVPPSVCLDPGKYASISFAPDLQELFPTGKMFNVRWPEGEANLVERGVGNWIRISLPIEYAAKRETLEVTLTVKDSKARISHY